jgi:hypothetical protein
VAGCCECGDEPSGSCATELVSLRKYVGYVASVEPYCLIRNAVYTKCVFFVSL